MNVSPRMILLHDKKLSIQIICQLLTDVNMDTVNDGRIQDHLDEFLWDGLKVCLPDFLTLAFVINYLA